MSKYKERGPYHFVEYADKNSPYHAHVEDLVDAIQRVVHPYVDLKNIHEVGCGEGLILYRLWLKLGGLYEFTGNDADDHAVAFAKELLPPWIKIVLDDDITTRSKVFNKQVVIFSDSLEHIHSWIHHLDWAKRSARVIVIAVPSAIDKHAVNKFTANSFDLVFVNGWKNEYRKTRDYRHVTIWVKQ
jgi:2-polyprenyl-3-methyl-5-hydroxy-6-metoxy-1,4-benzoquinol methylase